MNVKHSTIIVSGAAVLLLITAAIVLFMGRGGSVDDLLTLDELRSSTDEIGEASSGTSSTMSTFSSGATDGDAMSFQYSMYMRQESGEQIYRISYVEEGRVLVEPVSDDEAEAGMDEIEQEELWIVDDEKWETEAFDIAALLGDLKEHMIVRAMPSETLYYIQVDKGHIQTIEDPATLDEWEGDGWEDSVYIISDEEAVIFDPYLAEWEAVYAEQEEEDSEGAGEVEEPEEATESSSVDDRTVTGVVTNSVTGLPVPGVTVNVSHTSISEKTDVDGYFEIQLPSTGGSREIYVSTNSWYSASGSKTVSGGDQVSFSLSPASSGAYDLVFPDVTYVTSSSGGAEISGYVRNANTGEPITGVSFASSHSSAFFTVDEDGYFSEDSVSSGSHRFYITGDDSQYPDVYYQVDVVMGYMAIIEFEIDVQE